MSVMAYAAIRYGASYAFIGMCRHSRVVAVVGAGHLPGMREHWDDIIDIDAICQVPEKTPSRVQWGRLFITVVGTGSLFYYGTMLRRR